jgi:hypothetical protein
MVDKNNAITRVRSSGRDAPQYRGYEYILVGDDILIVNPARSESWR